MRSYHSNSKVLGSISGAWIQETDLRSSMVTQRKTEIKNLREQELICNCMLFGFGKVRLQTDSSSVRDTHKEREGTQWMIIESKHE
jgi:hypothetical protein